MWGVEGEKWTPQSRLPFFARAGYRSGDAPIPDVKAVTNVRDFGAKGDGVTDDTAAILKAVAATKGGALLLPAGRYVLRDTIAIESSHVVLRGEGPDKTVLVIPQSLEELRGADMKTDPNGVEKSEYAFDGSFVRVEGADTGKRIAALARPARRGDRVVELAGGGELLQAGNEVRLRLRDSERTLGRALHADLGDGGPGTYAKFEGKAWVDWVARVESVEGNRLTLDRPLRIDARLEWQPEMWSSAPTVSEVGIENLGFEFAGKPKKPHLKEEGFNAIYLIDVANCWVNNVAITDFDVAIKLSDARDCTVKNVVLSARKRQGLTGHHGLWASGGTENCLFTDFEINTTTIHDLTVANLASGNVFRRGRGEAINLDHHRNAPYENLFTDIELGNARRAWQSSGRGDRGPHAAARATFWNIRAAKGQFAPAPDWAQINIIGMNGLEPNTTETGAWIEPLGGEVMPADLYEAQRAYLRAGKSPKEKSEPTVVQ